MTNTPDTPAREDDAAFVGAMEFRLYSGDIHLAGYGDFKRLIALARRAAAPAPAGDDVERVAEAWRCRSPGCCTCDLPRCSKCGYTDHDARFHMDHGLCGGVIPATAEETAALAAVSERKLSAYEHLCVADQLLHDIDGSEDDRWHASEAHGLLHDAAAHMSPDSAIREIAKQEALDRKNALAAAETRGMMRAAEIVQSLLNDAQLGTVSCNDLGRGRQTGYADAVRKIRDAAPQPVEAGPGDAPHQSRTPNYAVGIHKVGDVVINPDLGPHSAGANGAPRVVDHPDAGYSEPAQLRWRPVRDTPITGGAYIVGGYVNSALGRHFDRAFGCLIRTPDGPSWSITLGNPRLPIEYWIDLGPHPERPLGPAMESRHERG